MTERLISSLAQISTIEDLKSIAPPAVVERLGGGERGSQMFLALVITLSGFAPEPAVFDRRAWNATVALDPQTAEPLSPELNNELIRIALETGLMKQVEEESDVYMTNPVLQRVATIVTQGRL